MKGTYFKKGAVFRGRGGRPPGLFQGEKGKKETVYHSPRFYRLYFTVEEKLGRIDVLIANAAVYMLAPLAQKLCSRIAAPWHSGKCIDTRPGGHQRICLGDLPFIKSALPLAQQETETIGWYALQMGPSLFGIFDTFETQEGRKAHLGGQIAAALMARAPELLAKDPIVEQVDILAVK